MNYIKIACILSIKMDVLMKKLILTIISTTFISFLYAQTSEKVEVITRDQQTALTLEMCKKKMGIDNYNFIKEIFNDENVVMMKCKEALSK